VPLLLVRHAQAKPRKEWDGEDRVRPLSPHGFRQADGLIAIMDNFAPRSRILSSPSLRCLQTVGPLASAQHVTVERTNDLREGQSSAAVSLVRALAGEEVAVCTHGDVIAEILVALADEDRLDLGQNPRQAKGSVWALDGRAGSFTSAKYFAPVVVDTV
jgi:broad specificity phosphatase PhoE